MSRVAEDPEVAPLRNQWKTSRNRPTLTLTAVLNCVPLSECLVWIRSSGSELLSAQQDTNEAYFLLKIRNNSRFTTLSPAQRLLFWRVAAAGGSVLVKSIYPPPKPALRRSLEQTGLVTQEQAPDPLNGRCSSRIRITSDGWAWAHEHMGGDFPNSPAASETLSLLLQAVAKFLRNHDLQAVDVLTCKDFPPKESIALEEPDTLFERFDPRLDTPTQMIDAGIVRQIVTLTSGRADVPIPLRSLRRLLDIHRPELDDALLRLHREERIELIAAPNPRAVSDEDRKAALFDQNGSPVHHVKLARQLEVAY